MPVWVSVQGAEELQKLSRRLKEQGRGDLQKKLRRNIREAGKPVVTDMRGAAMGVKVTSTKGGTARPDRSTGLRARTARAIGISQTRKGIRIRVSAKRFGPYGVTLPRYLDADAGPRWKRWRSPIFWPGPIGSAPASRVKQQTGSPYFFSTIRKHRAAFRRAVFEAMDDTAKELTR